MIILLSKGNKLKKELYHLYLHRTLTWSQVVGILEKSYEIKAVCVDFRGSSIEDEDLTNIETLRLARVPLCLVIDEDLQIEEVIDLSNESYGFDIPVQVEYDDIGLADYLSQLIGVDITNKVVRFVENVKKAEADLGDEARQKPLIDAEVIDTEQYAEADVEIDDFADEGELDFDNLDSEQEEFELDFENMDLDFDFDFEDESGVGGEEADVSDSEDADPIFVEKADDDLFGEDDAKLIFSDDDEILSDEELLGDLDEEDLLAGLDELDM